MNEIAMPALERAGNTNDRNEWLALMLEIAATDRDEYRRLREIAWQAVALTHQRKNKQELEIWEAKAS